MAERDGAEERGYGGWRSLELAIKDAAKKAARQAGPGISAASVDAQIRQARFDRFLSRVFAEGDQSEWLLKGGMSMLARVPRSRAAHSITAPQPLRLRFADTPSRAAGVIRSVEVAVQELDDPVDGALLDVVNLRRAVGARLREDVAVQRVVPRHPGCLLAGGRKQVVAHPEDAL